MNIQNTLYQLLPEKYIRTSILTKFAMSIRQAHVCGSDKWSIHCLPNKLRLHVGSVIIMTVHKGKLWLALDSCSGYETLNESIKRGSWTWDDYSYPRYTRIPSKNGFYLAENDQDSADWQSIEKLHFTSIHKASKHLLRSASQAKQDNAVIETLTSILDIRIPSPNYDSKRVAPIIKNNEITVRQENQFPEFLASTTRQTIIEARKGQGRFRKDLLSYWDNGCSVTGVSNPSLLMASHIKPWRNADNFERIDQFNGLLLTPNLDKLFDKHLISFDSEGHILITKHLSSYEKKVLGVSDGMKLRKITSAHEKYLVMHRDVFLTKQIQ